MHKQKLYKVKKRGISLTALIDVVFILLLFFMLTTSFSQWRAINISTATGIKAERNKETVNLLLMPDETISNYSWNVQYEAYKDIQLSDLALKKENEAIVLLPHQEVPLQLLIDVTQHFKTIGLKNVSIGHSFGEEIKTDTKNRGVL